MPGAEDGAPQDPAVARHGAARSAGLLLSELLQGLAQQDGRERVSVRDLIDALGDRALGALLFLFAVPNVLPMPPGTSVLLGMPPVFLAAQMMLGRRPWLPRLLASRSMPQADFAATVRRITPWVQRGERLLRPRRAWLALAPMEFAIGAVCLLLAVVVARPLRWASCCRRWPSACWRWPSSNATDCGCSPARARHGPRTAWCRAWS